ncbi:hypothetical protein LRP49_04465 [Enterovibrio sp. ZSDZ35]|uniref:Uncharacterized protein n=1 Tax=Enterovibrio qingdaonensis TaxID=2899818 RepID=A0ABT5QHK8_9GAMM|nr:hypothetical protein [Enterovibrio sp. ZSDZ35]MDD1780448.1 hypothetical protein [Enterovibrio sp. ZSDZ35]
MTTKHVGDKQLMDEMLAELNVLEKTLQDSFVDVQSRWNTLRECYLGYGADEAEAQYLQLTAWKSTLEDSIDLLRNSHLRDDEQASSSADKQAAEEVNV